MIKKVFVFVASPFKNPNPELKFRNLHYIKDFCHKISCENPIFVDKNISIKLIPLAPHLYFTDFLNDDNDTEREMGIVAGLAWMEISECVFMLSDYDRSVGMAFESEAADKMNREVHNLYPVRDGWDVTRKQVFNIMREITYPDHSWSSCCSNSEGWFNEA